MNIKQISILVILITVAFWSCKNDDETPIPRTGKYSNGVWVLNEGNFGTPNGTIGFYSLDSGVYIRDIYARENEGIPTGDVLQSMLLHEGVIYIIANNDNKILRMNSRNGKALSTWDFPELNGPRNIVVHNGWIYISNWGPFNSNFGLDESFILKMDLNGNSIKKILCQSGAEGMIIHNENLLISNSFSSTIDIMALNSDSIEMNIDFMPGPSSFAKDSEANIWVISTGAFISNGAIARIDENYLPDSVYEFGGTVGPVLLSSSMGTELFFYNQKAVLDLKVSDHSISTLISTSVPSGVYGLGLLKNGNVLVGDHNNFSGNGKVYMLNLEGTTPTISGNFEAGILPKQFIAVD